MRVPDPPLFGPPPVVIGHRGAPRLQRENTSAAFAAAAAAGATWVELDVRLDASGGAVVHHDPVLPDGRALIDLGAQDLAAAGVETLETVLRGLPAGLGLDLEIKNFPGEPDHDESMRILEVVADVLSRTGADGGDRSLLISSFNPLVLLAAPAHGLAHPRGLLTMTMDLTAGVEAAADLGCAAICPHDATPGLDAEGVTAAHDAGLAVMVWTVDDPARAVALTAAGVDAVCTNDPGGMVAALRPSIPPGAAPQTHD